MHGLFGRLMAGSAAWVAATPLAWAQDAAGAGADYALLSLPAAGAITNF